jgi:hypothetical protein
MSRKLLAIATIASAFFVSAHAKAQTVTPDRSDEIVDKAISTVKELCLVGLKTEYLGTAKGQVTLVKLTPGATIAGRATHDRVLGSVDINDPKMRILADENIRNCIKPFMPFIVNYVLRRPLQSTSPIQNATPVPPSKPKAKPRPLPDSAADNPPPPSQELTAKFECYQFYPVKKPDAWQFAETLINDNLAFLQNAKSSDDLRTQLEKKLEEKRKLLAESSGKSTGADAALNELNEREQWRAVLRKNCEMLNRAFPDPRQAMQRFRWLAIDIYPFELRNGLDVNNDPTVGDSAVRLSFLWTTYNNNFFDLTIFEATAFDDKYGTAGEDKQDAVGYVQIPPPRNGTMDPAAYIASDAVQAIFKNGLLNDVAVARWMWAKSTCALGRNAQISLRKLSRVSSGLAYDTRGFFWRPSDDLRSCN